MKLAVDTNLLVLLVGGLTDKRLLGRHKRLRAYAIEDFTLLLEIIERAQQIVVTPHVLAEASNLFGQDDDAVSKALRGKLASLLGNQEERHVPAVEIVTNQHFLRLGVADCGLLSILDKNTVLLTADVALYLAAMQTQETALNFNHLRPSAWV